MSSQFRPPAPWLLINSYNLVFNLETSRNSLSSHPNKPCIRGKSQLSRSWLDQLCSKSRWLRTQTSKTRFSSTKMRWEWEHRTSMSCRGRKRHFLCSRCLSRRITSIQSHKIVNKNKQVNKTSRIAKKPTLFVL